MAWMIPAFLARTSLCGAVLALLAMLAAAHAVAQTAENTQPVAETASAVVLMYHRFGEEDLPTTSIRIDQFEAHLAELKSGDYQVLPLPRIVTALRDRKPLPDRAVAITIDDAYRSVYLEAWPRLRAAGLPFTLFVSTDVIQHGGGDYMSWDEIRELARNGVEIGNQTASHPHLPTLPLDKARDEIRAANARIEAEIGQKPTLLAYPYGEYSAAIREMVANEGFHAAFGQHSGVAYSQMDRHQLPRFPLNENYGGLDRFRLVANALPLPVTDLTPNDPVLTGRNPPAIGFTVMSGIGDTAQLDCFASRQGRTHIERLPAGRIEIRLAEPLPAGRSRLNCTMPGPDSRWRWFGLQFYVPEN
jgi:peptidoglycan/xylan/chitin deacetylase (PgdA/CDA1 family)